MTETTLQVHDYFEFANSVEHNAIIAWLSVQGLDPFEIAANEEIRRDPEMHRIHFVLMYRDRQGKYIVDPTDSHVYCQVTFDQHEAGPPPFPEEILRRI